MAEGKPDTGQLDRWLLLIYKSSSAHDWTNWTRPHGWLDELPMKGLEELVRVLGGMQQDVNDEIDRRKKAGQHRWPVDEYHEKLRKVQKEPPITEPLVH